MSKTKTINQIKYCRNELPENFRSFEEFWAFWDTHSTANYEDIWEDVDIDIKICTSKVYCAIVKDIVTQIQNQVHQQGLSIQTLINLWLNEKVMGATMDKYG